MGMAPAASIPEPTARPALAGQSRHHRGRQSSGATGVMHRVHHSARPEETNRNFGFNLPWWDRLFGTYRDQPRDGHAGMTIGLEYFRGRQATTLTGLLAQPFLNERSALA